MSERRPREVSVLGKVIKITYSKEMIEVEGDGPCHGFFDQDNLTIEVVANDGWRSTLLHEILHAIFFITGHKEQMARGQEEAIVRALEIALADIVKLDPKSKSLKYQCK